MTRLETRGKQIEVPCQFEDISQANVRLEQLVADYFEDPDYIYLITLSIVEILCNVVEHGYGSNPPANESVRIEFKSVGKGLSVCLKDHAPELPEGIAEHLTTGRISMPAIDQGTENLPESGWGLNIVTSTASRIEYTRQGSSNITTLEFDESPPINLSC